MSPWLPSVLLWALVQLLGISQVRSKHLNSFAGPYIAFAHKFDVCPSDGTIVLQLRNSHFNPARPYDRQTISGNVTAREDVGDDFWGEYILKNESVSWTFPSFPVMPYGRYKFRVTSRSKGPTGPVAMCAEVDCEAIPKP